MRIIAAGVSEAIAVRWLATRIATATWAESPTSIIAEFVWEAIPRWWHVFRIAIPIGAEPPRSIYADNAPEAMREHRLATKIV